MDNREHHHHIIEGKAQSTCRESNCFINKEDDDAYVIVESESYRKPIPVRFDLIPPIFLRQLAEVYEEGSKVYGDAKYIEKPLPYSVIVNHMKNHLNLWLSGDRSELHLAKVAWGCASLIVLEDLAKAGIISSMCDTSNYGAKVQEALQKRLDNDTP